MRILDRYLAGIFVKNFALALMGLVALFEFQYFLGEVFSAAYPINQVFVYSLLNVPAIMVQMMPPAVLVATVLTLSGLSKTNELTACYSIGIGLRRISALLLLIVFIICCLILVLQDRILPPVFKKRTSYYWRVMKKKPDFFLDIKQDKIWYRSKNFIYNLRHFDGATKTIHGMVVYQFDPEFNLTEVTEARTAQFSEEGWRLHDGEETSFSREDPFPKTKEFKEKVLKIVESPKDFQEIEKEEAGLRVKELHAYIKRMKSTGADTKSFEVKLHSRISLSFMPLVMCILGIPFTLRSRREGGAAKDLGLCLGITFFYWLFYSVGLSLGTNGALPPWLAAWLPSAVFALLAGFLLNRARRGN